MGGLLVLHIPTNSLCKRLEQASDIEEEDGIHHLKIESMSQPDVTKMEERQHQRQNIGHIVSVVQERALPFLIARCCWTLGVRTKFASCEARFLALCTL
eukprot:scaffold346_cov347-Pavlova_lutheri.AAC.23